MTQRLKAPGFNPRACEVKPWFQAVAFECKLCRYTEIRRTFVDEILASFGLMSVKVGPLYKFANPVHP